MSKKNEWILCTQFTPFRYERGASAVRGNTNRRGHERRELGGSKSPSQTVGLCSLSGWMNPLSCVPQQRTLVPLTLPSSPSLVLVVPRQAAGWPPTCHTLPRYLSSAGMHGNVLFLPPTLFHTIRRLLRVPPIPSHTGG